VRWGKRHVTPGKSENKNTQRLIIFKLLFALWFNLDNVVVYFYE
jgi:hypothetical protein